jgi:hypothetical protein
MYEILEFLFVKSQDSILTVQCHLDTTCISKLTQSSPYSDSIVRDKKKLKALLLQRVGVNLAKSFLCSSRGAPLDMLYVGEICLFCYSHTSSALSLLEKIPQKLSVDLEQKLLKLAVF